MWTACKSLKSRKVKEGMRGMSLKLVWILLMETLGSHLLVVGSPMRQINSCTTLLSCASLMPLFPILLGHPGREGKPVCVTWSTLVRVGFVLLETSTKVGVLVLSETVASCLIPPLPDRSDVFFTFLKWCFECLQSKNQEEERSLRAGVIQIEGVRGLPKFHLRGGWQKICLDRDCFCILHQWRAWM